MASSQVRANSFRLRRFAPHCFALRLTSLAGDSLGSLRGFFHSCSFCCFACGFLSLLLAIVGFLGCSLGRALLFPDGLVGCPPRLFGGLALFALAPLRFGLVL